MKIGYMRVSKDKQTTRLQEDALKKEECGKIFQDKMTGGRFDRPGFIDMLAFAREGDVIVVWKLDRLGRSLRELIDTVNALAERKIDFISVTERFDTTTPSGKFLFHVMGAMAEFERELIRERTRAGLEAARARGKLGGRPKATEKVSQKTIERARALYESKEFTVKAILEMTGLKRTTFYKYVVNDEKEEGK